MKLSEEELKNRISKAIDDINANALTYYIDLQPSKGGKYVCPICGSGTHGKGTGALTLYKNPHRALCYAGNCFTDKGQDTVGALATIWKCSTTDVMQKLGYYISEPQHAAVDPAEHKPVEHEKIKIEAPEPAAHEDHTEQYKAWNTFLLQAQEAEEARQYLAARGVSEEQIKQFCIGYDPAFKSANEKIYSRDPRIIIPRDKETFLARAINNAALPKLIEGTQKAIFNAAVLTRAKEDPCCYPIIVEGELDALSVINVGYDTAIGIGSTSNIGILAEKARTEAPNTVYILCLDNDATGQKKQAELAAMLDAAGVLHVDLDTAAAFNGLNDPNEAMTDEAARNVFSYALYEAMQKAEGIRTEKEKQLAMLTGNKLLDTFLQDIQSRKYEPIPTGIQEIDKITNGGFLRQTLVMLGAAPGMGKTTLTQQIFESMAAAGHNVLFFNLEMSRQQLLAKSFSREIYTHARQVMTTTDILQGYKWTDRQFKLVSDEAQRHAAINEHLIYNPNDTGADLEKILACMNQTANRLRSEGKNAPIVVIDYLHLITTSVREDPAETLKRAVKAFTDYAIAFNTVVFAIVAFNRDTNKSGNINLSSGRDTSSIEYSAGLYMGLKWADLKDDETAEDRLNEFPRRVQLVILKQRFGETGSDKLKYKFWADRNYFERI